jgi:hypothetical protein
MTPLLRAKKKSLLSDLRIIKKKKKKKKKKQKANGQISSSALLSVIPKTSLPRVRLKP